ncbi:MAG: hypothetical protein J6J13_00085 [Clostridia bacterium]|nr:hypothetical protein [Clostridia bacterium]
MKKFICGMILTFLVLIAVFGNLPCESEQKNVVENIVTAENASENAALDARFLNMLNHNYVYNESFNCVDDIVNCSIPALLNLRDETEEYIAEYHVKDYVYNMYGIEIFDMSALNADFPQRQGYVYIIPRGFDVYKHKIDTVKLNEDGTYSVTTTATVLDQYGKIEEKKVNSLFVRNEDSDFGYNLVYSDIM